VNCQQPGRQLTFFVSRLLTFYFWIIKVMATVGETAADFLNTTLNIGLSRCCPRKVKGREPTMRRP